MHTRINDMSKDPIHLVLNLILYYAVSGTWMFKIFKIRFKKFKIKCY